jgi:hypothetical protein
MRVFGGIVLALTAVVAAAAAFVGTATAAPECRDRVIADWSDNGRLDRHYPLDCYEQAIRSMPPEIRDYSDATEVIDRALTLAARKQGQSLPPAHAVPASSTDASRTAIPTALIVLGALAFGAFALGGVGYAGYRAATGRRGAAR